MPPFKHLFAQFRAEFDGSVDGRSEIMGPTAAMISYWKGAHRFVLLIKTTELDRVRGFLRARGLHQRDDITIDIDPLSIL